VPGKWLSHTGGQERPTMPGLHACNKDGYNVSSAGFFLPQIIDYFQSY